MSDFNVIKHAVAARFATLATHGLYRSAVPKDLLWETYLASFPPGTNPIYKERTEHDCTCCKQFIRAVGNAVSIMDGAIVTIWDVLTDDPTYQPVAEAMAKLVKSYPIENKFLRDEPVAGTDKNFQDTLDGVKQWSHFFVNIPKQYQAKDLGPKLGEFTANFDVTKRGLEELLPEAVETVIELINQNSLYRGTEHLPALKAFQALQSRYDGTDTFVWQNCSPQTRFRNTVIGSLIVDLSSGVELEDAVKMFESKVAPTNYKRPTALVTKSMIEKARKSIEEAGLTSALERRYATINDITVNNILFADRNTPLVKGVFDDLIATAPVKTFGKVEEVSIDKFLSDILPSAKTLEVMMENLHQSNLVSLIAPADPTANNLFKWSNKFSWDYNGNVADSIKDRVKAAGGNVTGEFCCRLAWNNTDDLDFYMQEPNGSIIYFGNRGRKSACGGMLDVDANGCSGMMENPVENIFYNSISKMSNGRYGLSVKNYSQRQMSNQGFEVEIDLRGTVYSYSQPSNPRSSETVQIAILEKDDNGLRFITPLTENKVSKNVWGVNTNVFTKVNVLMMSPNYWDEQDGRGNKHYFFMLDACANEGQARGFYNEFLDESLTTHRKVLEMVGSKLQTAPASQQLSGLGFSSTQRASVLAKVTGAFTRIVRINF